MRVVHKKNSKIIYKIVQHIKDNGRAYLLISCLLLIGITLGVVFINNLQETQMQEVQSYLKEFINSLKENSQIDSGKLFQNSIRNNLILVITIWFAGSTIIGIPIVLGIVMFRGFCLGYTISALIAVLGSWKGTLFFVTAMLLQNLILIPCILALAVSGIKLYKSITKDKRKENIKVAILRHTIFSLIILLCLVLASFIETYISSNLFMLCIEYL